MPVPVTTELLPPRPAFVAPLADPRSPRSGVLVHLVDVEDSSSTLDASLAEEFPILGLRVGETHALQAELWAAAFMGFGGREGLTFDLRTFDGAFGLAFDWASGAWSARLEWMHESGHVADGFDAAAYSRVSGRACPDADASYDACTPYSREKIVLRAARRFGWARVHAGGSWTYHGADAGVPLRAQLGAEARAPWHIAPFGAVHVAYDAEEVARNPPSTLLLVGDPIEPYPAAEPGPRGTTAHAQLGAEVAVDDHRLRVALAAAAGRDDAGRLRDLPESYVGIAIGFDLYP